jgi:hypothetical protein
MTKAINCWAIYGPEAGLLLHSLGMSKFDAWARLNLDHRPDEPMRSIEDFESLGFVAIQVRLKFDEPERKSL